MLVKAVSALGNASYQTFDSNFNLTQTTDAAGRSTCSVTMAVAT